MYRDSNSKGVPCALVQGVNMAQTSFAHTYL